MELALAQVVLLGMLLQPGQLQLKVAFLVSHVDQDEAVAVFPSDLVKAQSLLIEGNGLFQVCHIVVFVNHLEFHKIPLSRALRCL